MAGEGRKITLRIPPELDERVEPARGLVGREVWIRAAMDHYLTCRRRVPGPDVGRIRSSEAAKRGVVMRPKAAKR